MFSTTLLPGSGPEYGTEAKYDHIFQRYAPDGERLSFKDCDKTGHFEGGKDATLLRSKTAVARYLERGPAAGVTGLGAGVGGGSGAANLTATEQATAGWAALGAAAAGGGGGGGGGSSGGSSERAGEAILKPSPVVALTKQAAAAGPAAAATGAAAVAAARAAVAAAGTAAGAAARPPENLEPSAEANPEEGALNPNPMVAAGPDSYCSPRHPTHFQPKRFFTSMPSYDPMTWHIILPVMSFNAL